MASKEQQEEDTDNDCPICLIQVPDLLVTPCGHRACQTCLERVLFRTSSSYNYNAHQRRHDYSNDHGELSFTAAADRNRNRNDPQDQEQEREQEQERQQQQQMEDMIIYSCPSKGRCPFCRKFIDLFDLKRCDENGNATEEYACTKIKNVCYSPVAGLTYGTKRKDFMVSFPAKQDDLPKLMLLKEHNDINMAEGQDQDVEAGADAGAEDADADADNTADGESEDATEDQGTAMEEAVDNTTAADREVEEDYLELIFEDEFHYNEKSKTFLGNIDIKKDVDGKQIITEQWEVIMQFSSDFRYVIHGVLVKRPKKPEVTDNIYHHHPFDGKWIFYKNPSSGGTEIDTIRIDDINMESLSDCDMDTVTICRSKFEYLGIIYHIARRVRDEDGCTIPTVIQSSSSNDTEIMFVPNPNGRDHILDDTIPEPEGPEVGSLIFWMSNNSNLPAMVWSRQTKEKLARIHLMEFGIHGKLLTKCHGRHSANKPNFIKDSLWGNVFIQSLTVGLASYHFISSSGEGENGAYISYENVRCSEWPPLDDGSPVPSRVPFVNYSFDFATRTFEGTIPWQEAYGTCWNGSASWRYKIVFDSEFLCILSGNVFVSTNADASGGTSFSEREMSVYGEHLNYINAAIVDRIKYNVSGEITQTTPDGETSEATVVDRIMNEIQRIKNHLLEEDVHPRTLEVMLRGARGALFADRIDYNL